MQPMSAVSLDSPPHAAESSRQQSLATEFMSDHYDFKCPHCEKVLRVPTSVAGKAGKCPACSQAITAPQIDESKPSRAEPQEHPQPTPQSSSGSQLDQQPTHRAELSQDGRRLLGAISLSADKFDLIQPYLMDYEEPVAVASQRQFPFSVFSDIVLLSSHRLMVFKRFFTKITMFDVNYVDFGDVKVSQGFFTSELIISTTDGRRCVAKRLVTDQALKVYRQCQDVETKARMARREFQLEENRSHTTQMQINTVHGNTNAVDPYQQALPPRRSPGIGTEESNPYRLGE